MFVYCIAMILQHIKQNKFFSIEGGGISAIDANRNAAVAAWGILYF